MTEQAKGPVVGVALGSGTARGWAHIGVLLELEQIGVKPQVVAGTSIGALVGAVYTAGHLKEFAEWVQTLTVREVFSLMDLTFSGGVVKGERLFSLFMEKHPNPNIEDLPQRYVSVTTEMQTGREVWITRGSILAAARASCAMPGLFSPVKFRDQWMLDGGLVNPVPVSAARALGADIVIAVNLNAQLMGPRVAGVTKQAAPPGAPDDRSIWQKVADYISGDPDNPRFFDVIAASVNIMQDRITRSRMAGDPPELTLVPLLADFAVMDFHRAGEAIEEGRRLVQAHAAAIQLLAGLPLEAVAETTPGLVEGEAGEKPPPPAAAA